MAPLTFKAAAISDTVKPEQIEMTPAKSQTKMVAELDPVLWEMLPILKKTPAPITEPITVASAWPKEICFFTKSLQ